MLIGDLKISINQINWLRKALAVLLGVKLVDYSMNARDLFTSSGVWPVKDGLGVNMIFPNVLLLFDHPVLIQIPIWSGVVVAILFFTGRWTRVCALILWYLFASLFNRNLYLNYPSFPYISWMLLLFALVDFRDKRYLPKPLAVAALVVLGLTLSSSGYMKFISLSWKEGLAVNLFTKNYGENSIVWAVLSWLPLGVSKFLCWKFLFVELFAPLFLIFYWGRVFFVCYFLVFLSTATLVLDYKFIPIEMMLFLLLVIDFKQMKRGLGVKWPRSFAISR